MPLVGEGWGGEGKKRIDGWRRCAILALELVQKCNFPIKILPQNLFYKILCLPFQQGKLEIATSFVFHEWFLGRFLISAKKSKNSQICQMSYINTLQKLCAVWGRVYSTNQAPLQYKRWSTVQIRHFINASKDVQYKQVNHQILVWGLLIKNIF